jgi:hypothetical protein
MSTGVTIEGLDLIDVINFMNKKNKKYQALLLKDLEDILGKDSDQFHLIRKLVLDSYNDYTRSIIRLLFGNIEEEQFNATGHNQPS